MLIHLLSCEEDLSLVFECLHESFSLEMWVEAHGWPNLLFLLSWSHLPSAPLWLRRCSIDITVIGLGCFYSLSVWLHGFKTHHWRPNHLPLVFHLREPLSVIIRLFNRLYSHFLNERGDPGLIIGNQAVTSALCVANHFWGRRRVLGGPLFMQLAILVILFFELINVEHCRYWFTLLFYLW